MLTSTDKRLMYRTWIFIGICTALRYLYAHTFLLVPDETNYWQWSRHLAWGYHDQAPLIAWAIHLSTLLLGQSEAAVRLPSILAMTVVTIYLVAMARQWFNERIAWQTAIISQSVLLFNIGALLATTDGLQAAAWAGAAYHTARAFERDRWRHWLLGGVWFGFGMLSKYTMVLFLPCVLAYALFSPEHRKRMAGIKPYVGCLIGMAMFFPVIAWNAAHNWNSVRHVAYIGGANQGYQIHFNFLADFIGSQAALLTPFIFILVCAGWIFVIRRRYPKDEWIYSFLLFTSMPVVAGFAVLSLHSRVYGNWPGAGYVTAILLVAACCAFHGGSSKTAPLAGTSTRWFYKMSVGTSYVLTGLLLAHILFGILPVPAHLDRTADEIDGWDRLGQRVAQVRQEMPNPDDVFIFGLQYQLASELAFYVPGQPDTVSINRWNRPNVYDYWWQDSDLLGRDAVGVHSDGHSRERLLEAFERVSSPEPFNVFRSNLWASAAAARVPLKTLYIYRCYGFKGGLRWVPPDPSDVRAVGR